MNTSPRIAFFGTDPLAGPILAELEAVGITPALIVAGADKLDRKKNPVAPTEKQWAHEHGVAVLQPEKIDTAFLDTLRASEWDLFIVASYGKILPTALLSIPKRGVLNVHPSLLPLLRGPSPIRSAILHDMQETGVTIMQMDAEMDHGPIISQKKIRVEPWPMKGRELDALLANEGARLLASVVPLWLTEDIEAREQNHELATYCSFLEKEHGEINLSDDARANLLKIHAYDGWPSAFFFAERAGKRMRVQIVDAHIEHGKLILDTVKPEGKSVMSYPEFERGNA